MVIKEEDVLAVKDGSKHYHFMCSLQLNDFSILNKDNIILRDDDDDEDDDVLYFCDKCGELID